MMQYSNAINLNVKMQKIYTDIGDLSMINVKRPNILMIIADQHRHDCIGGSTDYPVKTPNLNKLAAEGMKFSSAYTTLPACCPARQSMLRGRRPESFGALWNFGGALKTGTLSPSDYTWAKEIGDNGYKTCHIGKWQISPEYGPESYGYDTYISDKEYYTFRKNKYGDNIPKHGWLGGKDDIPVEDSHTHYLADRTAEMILKYSSGNSPWLINLNFSGPHLPCTPSGKFAEMYKPVDFPVKKSFKELFENKPYIQKQQLISWGIENYTWREWSYYIANYCGMVSQIDDAIGLVLSALEESGSADDTVVIYTADHGDMGGSHRMMDKHYVMYDDIVRVPFIIKWPKVVKPGTECDEFISNGLDLAPTILDAAQLPAKEEGFFHGLSIVPLLKENAQEEWRKEIACTYNGQQFGLYTQRMVRNTKWKYVWNTTDIDELYNIEDDPNEMVNLVHEEKYSNVLKELRHILYKILSDDGDELVKNQWTKKQLLGSCKL